MELNKNKMRYKNLTIKRLDEIEMNLKVLVNQMSTGESIHEIHARVNKIKELIDDIKGNLELESEEWN